MPDTPSRLRDDHADDVPSTRRVIPLTAADGARSELILLLPPEPPKATLLWLAAMGVAAKHYLPLADELTRRGIAVALHEWRGIGSSDQRAGRQVDWSYRQLLENDLPISMAALRNDVPHGRCFIGGHSLGGQLACLYTALHPQTFAGIALVASGAPYWRAFRHKHLLYAAYALAPGLASLVGYLPGRRIGFGGNEARGLIRDWARSGRSGRYAAAGLSADLEQALGEVAVPVLGIRQDEDWLVPRASLEWLMGKMPRTAKLVVELDGAAQAGIKADHFSWMKNPAEVASRLVHWMGA